MVNPNRIFGNASSIGDGLDRNIINKRSSYWIGRLKDCERTHIGSHEAKSQVLVELIISVQEGNDYRETAEKVVREVPSIVSLGMAIKKLGLNDGQ